MVIVHNISVPMPSFVSLLAYKYSTTIYYSVRVLGHGKDLVAEMNIANKNYLKIIMWSIKTPH